VILFIISFSFRRLEPTAIKRPNNHPCWTHKGTQPAKPVVIENEHPPKNKGQHRINPLGHRQEIERIVGAEAAGKQLAEDGPFHMASSIYESTDRSQTCRAVRWPASPQPVGILIDIHHPGTGWSSASVLSFCHSAASAGFPVLAGLDPQPAAKLPVDDTVLLPISPGHWPGFPGRKVTRVALDGSELGIDGRFDLFNPCRINPR